METINQNRGNKAQALIQEADVSDPRSTTVTNNSPPAAKIKLFRSLFRDRPPITNGDMAARLPELLRLRLFRRCDFLKTRRLPQAHRAIVALAE